MSVRRMAAVDAQNYWTSAKIPSDEFLVYGFAGTPDVKQALAQVRERARRCPEFGLRIRDRGRLAYPEWATSDISGEQFVEHPAAAWGEYLAAVGRLHDDQLDPRSMAWRLHVFPAVEGIPGADRGVVAVVQMAHALADGRRGSALVAWLFGREAPVAAVDGPPPLRGLTLPWRGFRAARAHQRLVRDTAAGLVAPQAGTCPALRSNARPEGARNVRTLVRKRAQVPGPTVTVGVLAAVSAAMSAHLGEMGDDPSLLRAEVPMAKAGKRLANNHFGNVSIGLHPKLPFDERAARIAEEFEQRRGRAAHPAMIASDRASAAVPAPLLRWGVGQFDPTVRSPTVIGNTVVSSVNRGAADLSFGGAPVVLTAGVPALSPMMGLTHGVHGIGDTIAITVHASESAIGDFDSYVERLDAALASP